MSAAGQAAPPAAACAGGSCRSPRRRGWTRRPEARATGSAGDAEARRDEAARPAPEMPGTPGTAPAALAAGCPAAALPYARRRYLTAPGGLGRGFPPATPEHAQASSPITPRPATRVKNRRCQYASASRPDLCYAVHSDPYAQYYPGRRSAPADPPAAGPSEPSDVRQSCIVMTSRYLEPVLDWYADHARDLPWRSPDASPWSILVSEIMLQQTPVARVLPAHRDWLSRWPAPADLAAVPAGEAVRQWGRLGYPRRALWLHEAARILTERHGGERSAVVRGAAGAARYRPLHRRRGRQLRLQAALPGPRHQRAPGDVPPGHRRGVSRPHAVGRRMAAGRVAASRRAADRGPLVGGRDGTRRAGLHRRAAALCGVPPRRDCSWLKAGRPPPPSGPSGSVTRGPTGSAGDGCWPCSVTRKGPSPAGQLDAVWPVPVQRARALDGLVADGLVDVLPDGHYGLPGLRPAV